MGVIVCALSRACANECRIVWAIQFGCFFPFLLGPIPWPKLMFFCVRVHLPPTAACVLCHTRVRPFNFYEGQLRGLNCFFFLRVHLPPTPACVLCHTRVRQMSD